MRSLQHSRTSSAARVKASVALSSLAIVAIAAMTAGCGSGQDGSEEPGPRPRGIVLVTVGGLRADASAIPPELAEAIAFERAYSGSSLDVQSLAAVFAGRLPTRGGSIGVLEAQPAPQATTLATRLRRAGFATGLVSQSGWASREGFTRGFDQVEVAPEDGWSTDEVTRRSLGYLGGLDVGPGSGSGSSTRVAARPFFLAAHYAGPLAQEARTDALEELADSGDWLQHLSELEQPELEHQYRREEAAVLAEVAALLTGLRQSGLLETSLVVVAGTAGFELREHGGTGNGWTTYDEVVRVPLYLLWPQGLGAKVADDRLGDPVSLLDVTPTLLRLAGAEAPAGEEEADGLDGSALLEPFDGLWVPRPKSGPRISELVARERAIARSVIDGDFAYVYTQRFVPPADRPVVASGIEEIQAAMLAGSVETPPLWGEAERQELYDLASDPLQQSSILGSQPAPLAVLRAALRSYRARCEESAWQPLEITRRLEIDPEQLRQLESLGYL